MSVVMKIVFSLSLSGALLILVLLLCKPLLKNRFSRQWQYYVWFIVLVRLLLPVAPEVSAVGILFSHNAENTQMSAAPVSEGDMSQNIPTAVDTNIQYHEVGQRDDETAVSEIFIQNVIKSFLQNMWIPWLVVALLLLIRKITIYQSFVKYIKAGRKEISDTVLLDRLAQIEEQAGVRCPVELYENSLVSSPLLIGFFRPCIILPTATLTEGDFTFTIWHELIHFKRKDMFYKWLVQITVCLHWFNPLVWLMGREINHACEFACDEAVLGALGEQERRAYGDTLFRALGAGGNYKDYPVSVTLNEDAELLKERLGAIMDFKKSSKLVTTLSIFLAAAMMMGATAMGAYVEPLRTAKNMEAVSANASSKQAEKNNTESTNIGYGDVENNNISKSDKTEKSKKSMQRLAEQYYEKDMLIQFGAIFSAFDESLQRQWLDRFYEDDEISYFSIALNHLHNTSSVIEDFAQKAYSDNKVNFFSVLTGYMSADLLKNWQDRVM
nr:M56 family metallopeptidase [Lachnospiraceae bacterium]